MNADKWSYLFGAYSSDSNYFGNARTDEKLPDPQGALTRDLPLSAISSIN